MSRKASVTQSGSRRASVQQSTSLIGDRSSSTAPKAAAEIHPRISTLHKTSNVAVVVFDDQPRKPDAEPWRRGRSNFILTRFLFLRSSLGELCRRRLRHLGTGCTGTTTLVGFGVCCWSGLVRPPRLGIHPQSAAPKVRVYLWAAAARTLLETNTAVKAARRSSTSFQEVQELEQPQSVW